MRVSVLAVIFQLLSRLNFVFFIVGFMKFERDNCACVWTCR